MMEPLYTVNNDYSLDEFRKNAWKLFLTNRKKLVTILLYMLLLSIMSVLLFSFALGGFTLAYPAIYYFINNRRLRKLYDSDARMQKQGKRILFYEDHFVTEGSDSGSIVYYNELYSVKTDRWFVRIMYNNTSGSAIEKSRLPEGLEEFLQSRVPYSGKK